MIPSAIQFSTPGARQSQSIAFLYGMFDRSAMRFVAASVLLMVMLVSSAIGQTATLRGFVTDDSDGLPLLGVNVSLKAPDGDLFGNATNLDGFYTIVKIQPGTYQLEVSYLGYETITESVTFVADEIQTRNFEMGADQQELGEVLVEGERETAGAAAVSAGLQTIRVEDIETIPTPDVSADLVAYITTIPGVVSSGDQGGQLFVRGGEPTQNLVLLDGMVIYQPFHLIGFYSAFPADIMNTADVYAGGFGARFGGRLSSVLNISSRSGNMRRFDGMVSLAPFVSGARLEGPLWKDKASILLSGRTSVIEQGAAKIIDAPLPYKFDDQFAKLSVSPSQNHRISLTGLRTFDRGFVGDAEEEGELDQVLWQNEAFGARYILLPTKFPVFAEILLSSSRVLNEFGPSSNPTRSSRTSQFNGEANLTHFLGSRADLHWGVYVRSSTLDSELGGAFQNVRTDVEYVTEAGTYFEPEIKLDVGTGLRIQPGIRLQTFPSKSLTFIEPRLRIVQDYGFHRLSFATGIYHQELVGINDRRDAGDVFTAWTSSDEGQVSQAVHVVGGYQLQLPSGVDFSLEGFYKDLKNLSVAEWTAFPRFSTNLQLASGEVYGGDVRVEVAAGPFYGFANYGYSVVEYTSTQESLPLWYGVSELAYPPPHDRRHQINALLSVRVFKVNVGMRWQYGSGLPLSEALGFDEYVFLDGPKDLSEEPGGERVLYGLPYQARLPDYHRLDFSIDRTFEFSRRFDLTLQGSLTNTYDRKNLFYIDLFTLRRINQLPLIPSMGLKIEFK
ncbi:MAG: TonB-dependent receptor plug domain-containing protein [Rhodothermales bacterium]|nr:TonB-dependent receptor plug domain-containing protein [Rhodothermales bacterium]